MSITLYLLNGPEFELLISNPSTHQVHQIAQYVGQHDNWRNLENKIRRSLVEDVWYDWTKEPIKHEEHELVDRIAFELL